MPDLHCKICGGTLLPNTPRENQSQCNHCQKIYDTATAERNAETLRGLFDAQKLERIHNLRRVLYDAVTAQYISRADVTAACDALRQYLPDDFAANFYRTVAGGNLRAINAAIREIDVDTQREDMDNLVEFLIRSITGDNDFLLALADLIERAYKSYDLKRYSRFSTKLTEQSEQVLQGVYETALPRDVFVAYSSKDSTAVLELVEALEEQGITCFVALRNLKHGVGSVENYNAALKEAMNSCTIFLFVSTMNSRNLNCDAVKVEMNYIRTQDVAGAPAEYRYSPYATIPHKYKKPRVEYYLEESSRLNIADKTTNQFFDGYERVYEVEGVLTRVASILMGETDEADRRREEEEAQRRAEEEMRSRIEAETRRRIEIEEETRRRVEEEARLRAEEEARQRAEAEARRRAEEAEQQRQAEERRRAEEAERQRQAEVERQRQEEARRRAAAQADTQWKVGNTVTFGSYEQNPGRGNEPIEWIVLANEGKRALVISKYILDCQQYHPQYTAITWENCSLRKWLNSTFLNAAFNATERGRILASRIKNPNNGKINGGNDTTDHVFCLSIDEANRYLASNAARAAKATTAIKAKGKIHVKDGNGNACWWLRSPGSNASYAADVLGSGTISSDGSGVNYGTFGVRPAMWIDISESGSTPAPTTPPAPVSPIPKLAPLSVPAVGGTFKFGSYEQNPGMGKEPIEWIVLANEGNRALLISKYILDCQPYHLQDTAITWENCSLRKWLNSTFLNAAFSATERGRILASRIKNPNNAEYSINGGNDTTDSIFCLSIDEANRYFELNVAREAEITPLIKAKRKTKAKHGDWWLRSPGRHVLTAANIGLFGSVYSKGNFVTSENIGVRPALWINLES